MFSFHIDKDDDSFRYLAEANNKGEWMWRILLKYIMAGFAVVTTITAIISVLMCFIMDGHFNTNDLYRPYKFT